MKVKYLSECSYDELKKVYDSNSDLQHDVFEDMMDNAAMWCEEYLSCFDHGVNYCIGWDRGAHFTITDKHDFLRGLDNAQRAYCFLPDSYNEKIKAAREELNRDPENETQLDEMFEELETACFDRLMGEYKACFDDEIASNYFADFYVSERMSEEEYLVHEDYTIEEFEELEEA